jgi:LuxR family maltose regulon positive regulatory protein
LNIETAYNHNVPANILSTKLFIPPPRKDLVSRPRLIEALRQGSSNKLTLISAPAGYGKTTLLSEWIDLREMPFGWLSLDQGDNNLDRFMAYLYASLSSIPIEVEDGIAEDFGSVQDNPLEELLIPLINQISLTEGHFTLVLDDYYLIHDAQVHEIVSYLLNHLPSQMHLVIATRTDPQLRLSQLRAQGELCEIRAEELRFTDQEAIHFLNQSMNLGLASDDIHTLTQKTEGWIAGLQLAALSLQGHQDKRAFISAFAGDDRYIADYLLDEALKRQPSHIQNFLLQTSILERLCAPLCNAVTGRNDSQAILIELELANLFLVPLDSQRNWFRYHQLFADLLNNRLHQLQAQALPSYHKKASTWYQENDLYPDALNHALAINDLEQIIDLTAQMSVYNMDYKESIALLAWLGHLPESVFRDNPRLLVTRTWALLNTGEYSSVEANLAEIESMLLHTTISSELATILQGHIAAVKSSLAELLDDEYSVIQQAEQALGYLPANEVKLRSFVSIRRANCIAWLGELDKAIPIYQQVGEASKLVGDGHLAIAALSEMSVIQMFTGKLRLGMKNIAEVNNYAEMLAQRDGRRLPAMGILYRHLSYFNREQNKLSEAAYYAQEAVEICKKWGEKEALLFGYLALAKVQFSKGEFQNVAQSCNRFLKIAAQISPKAYEQLKSWKIYFELLQGKVDGARMWLGESSFSPSDQFGYERRFEFQNLALYLTAIADYSQALEVNHALLKVVMDAGDMILSMQHQFLQAVILEKMNKTGETMVVIEAALNLAADQGYVRTILDLGEPVIGILYKAAQRDIQPEYCLHLIHEFEQASPSAVRVSGRSTELVEELSDREIEVLNLIAKGSTNQEIAQELILSLYTVKSHARNIYSKLGVKNRTEAVARARMLGLLAKE